MRKATLVLSALFALASCGKSEPSVTEPEDNVTQKPAATFVIGDLDTSNLIQRKDDESLRGFLNLRVPGYAGIAFDEGTNSYSLYIKKNISTMEQNGLERLTSAAGYSSVSYGLNRVEIQQQSSGGMEMNVFYVKYSLEELDRMSDKIISLPSAKHAMIIIDSETNKIIVTPEDGAKSSAISTEILNLGIPADAFEVRGTFDVIPDTAVPLMTPMSLSIDYLASPFSGLAAYRSGTNFYCSLGPAVTRQLVNETKGVLTAGHCVRNLSDQFLQQGKELGRVSASVPVVDGFMESDVAYINSPQTVSGKLPNYTGFTTDGRPASYSSTITHNNVAYPAAEGQLVSSYGFNGIISGTVRFANVKRVPMRHEGETTDTFVGGVACYNITEPAFAIFLGQSGGIVTGNRSTAGVVSGRIRYDGQPMACFSQITDALAALNRVGGVYTLR